MLKDIDDARTETFNLYKTASKRAEKHLKITEMTQKVGKLHVALKAQLDVLESEMELVKCLHVNVDELLAGEKHHLELYALTDYFGACNEYRRKLLPLRRSHYNLQYCPDNTSHIICCFIL